MTAPNRVKATLDILKMTVGETLVGRFTLTQPRSTKYGPSHLYIFERLEMIDGVPSSIKGTPRVGLWASKGLERALEDALLLPGDVIEVVRLESVELAGGNEVNQFEVYKYPDLAARPAHATAEAHAARA